MFGCRGFTEDEQKIKAMQANCQKSSAPSGQPQHAVLQFEQQVAVCVTVSKKQEDANNMEINKNSIDTYMEMK